MTSTLAADSKLMYYPTDLKEVYRIVFLLSRSVEVRQYALDDEARAVYQRTINSQRYHWAGLLDHLIATGQTDAIDDAFLAKFGADKIVVLDPFAGEGVWLNAFKSNYFYFSRLETAAIEIEENRFKKIEADFKVNAAFEDLSLPPKSVSILLYNPPYGSTNGIRNVRYYLQDLIEQDVLISGGVLACVIKEDDAIGIADLLYSNFNLQIHYRVNEAEYAKYKQCVLLLEKNAGTIPLDTPAGMDGYTKFKESLIKRIESGVGFESLSGGCPFQYFPSCPLDFGSRFSKYNERKPRNGQFSAPDRAWKWLCDDSRARLSEHFELTMPKSPKISEIANLLASGIINGQIDDPEAPHVVSGGVKSVKRREEVVSENADGDEIVTLKEIRFSQPYLNILTIKDGKPIIKQIESVT